MNIDMEPWLLARIAKDSLETGDQYRAYVELLGLHRFGLLRAYNEAVQELAWQQGMKQLRGTIKESWPHGPFV